jgi:formiminotetrahydrofolate cyclodeaminase
VAAACAVAAAQAAELNVLINMGQLEDAGFVEETRRELADLVPRVERESEDLLRQVRGRLQ